MSPRSGSTVGPRSQPTCETRSGLNPLSGVARSPSLSAVPLWRADPTEWSKVRVARLRYSISAHNWSLYWADRTGRWHLYDDLPPGRIDQVLREIESDPAGIFWG